MRARASLAARLWSKVILPLSSEGIPTDDPNACWAYGGYIGKNNSDGVGYGQIREEPADTGRGRLVKAHRVSYELVHGPIPHGWDVCHACDYTVCINPFHLFAAPHKANMHDYIRKYGGLGRPKSPITVTQLVLFRDVNGSDPCTLAADLAELSAAYDCGQAVGDGKVPF